MKIHLIDGTYELFRQHFGAPPKKAPDGAEVGATLGLIRSLLMLLQSSDVTHVGVAFDHVIESFRNELYPGYKSSEGVDQSLLAQFSLAEAAVAALGVVVWSMVQFEADDALATAAKRFKENESVEQIVIASPDKDLSQCVSGERIVCWDRRRDKLIDEAGVIEKFGVGPESIPDWLGVVGDSADGFPGVPGWGAKSASAVLGRYKKLEAIPKDPELWNVASIGAGRAAKLAESLAQNWENALLFRELATLRSDVPINEALDDLEWKGARQEFKELCSSLGDENLALRVTKWQESPAF